LFVARTFAVWTAAALHHMAMKVDRSLHWDPLREPFTNDDDANAMLRRPQRPPYVVDGA
jgi:hypothetical protein